MTKLITFGLTLAQTFLILEKSSGRIHSGWVTVLSPLWIPILSLVIYLMISFIATFLISYDKIRKGDDK